MVSAGAVVAALRIAGKDRRRQLADRADEERGQAAMVVCEPLDSPFVRFTNFGARPIRDLTVIETKVGGDAHLTWTPDGVARRVATVLAAGEFVRPFGAWHRIWPDGRVESRDAPPDRDVIMTIEFVDSDNHRWRRVGFELPTRVTSP